MTNILRLCNWISSLLYRRSLSMKSAIRGGWGTLPNKQNRIRCTPMHCLPICERPKSHLRKGIAVKNKVIVKDKDEWSSLANFIGNIIAKYADEIDFDSLPDPDVYLQKRYIYESYKAYTKFRNRKTK